MSDEIIEGGRDEVVFVDLQRTHDPEWSTRVNGVHYIVEKLYGEERENDIYAAWVDGIKEGTGPADASISFAGLAAKLLKLGDPNLPLIERIAIKVWEHRGVRCAVAASPGAGLNGYVRLPKIMWSDWSTPEEARQELDFAPINWGPHEGYIGFDTQHGGDYWDLNDLRGHQPQMSIDFSTMLRRVYMDRKFSTEWTMQKLTDVVEALATRVSAYTMLDSMIKEEGK